MTVIHNHAHFDNLDLKLIEEFRKHSHIHQKIKTSYAKFKNGENPDLDDVRSGLACLKKRRSKMTVVWKKEEKLPRKIRRVMFSINMTIPLTLNHWWNSTVLKSRLFSVTPLNEDEQVIYEVERS